MKLLFALILLALVAGFAFAQDNSVETSFNRNIKKYTREKYGVGEDASSGSFYLVYKNKAQIVKMRVIRINCCDPPKVEDFYFENDRIVLYAALLLTEKRLKTFANGSNRPLTATKKLYFKDSKLTAWIANGQTVPATDPKWAEEEQAMLERAKDEFEFYPELKEM